MFLIAMTQAVAAAAPASAGPPPPTKCERTQPIAEEVLVCAPRRDKQSPYRLKPSAPAEQSALPKAQAQLGEGVIAAAENESAMVGTFPSNRMMLRLKIKF